MEALFQISYHRRFSPNVFTFCFLVVIGRIQATFGRDVICNVIVILYIAK